MSNTIQYTIRGITPAADARLRAQASKQGLSLNKLLLTKLDALPSAKVQKPKVYHDLDWFFEDMTPERIADADAVWQTVKEARAEDRRRAQAELAVSIQKEKAAGK